MASRIANRYVIGVYSGWESLVLVVEALGRLRSGDLVTTVIAKKALFSASSLLNGARSVADQLGLRSNTLDDLPSHDERSVLACTSGELATQVNRRIQDHGGTLCSALSIWMPASLAQRLESEALDGKILLWVRIILPEYEAEICETMLASVPNRIEVLDLVPLAAG
jgi:hypothetical protein